MNVFIMIQQIFLALSICQVVFWAGFWALAMKTNEAPALGECIMFQQVQVDPNQNT